jgi:hypothetical protein
MDSWVYFAAGGVFVLFIITYVIIMVIWPEWVGITGKVALDAERAHRGGTEASDAFMDSLHKPSHPSDPDRK